MLRTQIHALKLLSVVLLLAPAPLSAANFTLTGQSAVFDGTTDAVTFTLDFNAAPDFLTVDALGRQANSFQIFVIGDPTLPYPQNYDSIVRGEELHLSGDELRIRNSFPPVSDPAAGDWGSLRGEVPFTVEGNVLSFTSPLSVLSDHSSDGQFSYLIESYQYGADTADLRGETTVTPEPTSLLLLGTGLLAIALSRRRSALDTLAP